MSTLPVSEDGKEIARTAVDASIWDVSEISYSTPSGVLALRFPALTKPGNCGKLTGHPCTTRKDNACFDEDSHLLWQAHVIESSMVGARVVSSSFELSRTHSKLM